MGGLFKPPKVPAPPPPVEAPTAPDQDDEAIRRARRRSLAASQARSGVLSTIRPSAGGSLGARTVLGGRFDHYGNKTLGGS